MCGVFAVIQRAKPIDEERLRRATNTLEHRGPDAGHIATKMLPSSSGDLFIGFGHRRLSIIDLNSRSDQPFNDHRGMLTYNGEIYNFHSVRENLEDKDPFYTLGDTEVMHRALAQDGEDALNSFNGMWAFAFFDPHRRKIIAARDRYGKKPLFYYADGDTLCLASEAKAIFAYIGMKPTMRRDKVAAFIAHGLSYPDPNGEMFFENIHEVRPGHALTLTLDDWQLSETRWFDFAAEVQSERPPLAETFESAVLARLISDRPVGLLLSGGIDSSLILSVLAARGLQHQVHCFIGETGAGVSDDAIYARQCAHIAGVKAEEIVCDYGHDAFDRVLAMCANHEKPFPLTGNSVAMYEMYAHIAARDVKVVIDGTGGDEVFGGYWDRYIRFALRDALRAGDSEWLEKLLVECRNLPESGGQIRAAMRNLLLPITTASPHPLAQRWGKPSVQGAKLPDPLLAYTGDLTGAMAIDASAGRLSEWIWHNDRNAMAFGIENRSPFLDCRLISMINQPLADKFNGAWNKYALRQIYNVFLEMPTQWRQQKQGFRWTSKPFLIQNRESIRDLIEASQILNDYIAVADVLDATINDDHIMGQDFMARLLSIAALEKAFCV
jgi:asparagine synthase (glutamine-hydrolysing)